MNIPILKTGHGKPRCLYVSYDGLTEPLGRSQILPYLDGLSKRGIKFVVLTFDKKAYRYDRAGAAQVKRDLKKKGNEWVSLLYHKHPPILSTFFDVGKGLLVSIFLIIKYKIRVVHARSYVAAFLAFFLKRIFCTKFVFDMRGFWVEERVESHIWKRDSLIYKVTKYLEKRFLIAADSIIVLTQKAKMVLDDSGFLIKPDISVIQPSTDTGLFNLASVNRDMLRVRLNLGDSLTFMHAGSLESWYMLEEMFHFVKVMKDTGFKVRLVILSHQKKDLYALSRKVGLEDAELVYRAATYREMPDYISCADVGLFFVSPTPSKVASMPSKFAEYLGCGMPVVCNTNIGDLESIIRENRIGVLVKGFEKESYRRTAEELRELLKERDISDRCRAAAVKFFSLDSAVDKYYSIYRNILS